MLAGRTFSPSRPSSSCAKKNNYCASLFVVNRERTRRRRGVSASTSLAISMLVGTHDMTCARCFRLVSKAEAQENVNPKHLDLLMSCQWPRLFQVESQTSTVGTLC